MERGRVTYVILGVLSLGPRSGYEIKRLVDRSTRHFWAASYGQIYPELHRLEREGLVAGASEPRGGRRRTVYRITSAGHATLRRWLREPGGAYELRDERLLKLFFADAAAPNEAFELVEDMRAHHERVLGELRKVEASGKAMGFPKLVLEYGIGFHTWIVDWCRRAEKRLASRARKEAAQ